MRSMGVGVGKKFMKEDWRELIVAAGHGVPMGQVRDHPDPTPGREGSMQD